MKVLFLGTGSDVGKSICATALCRILKNRGIRVAPFKAQNMSNNSFVTAEGGEIGRAQAAQAEACKIAPSVHMNPVLLKPVNDMGAQVVIRGQVHGNMKSLQYYGYKTKLKQIVTESFRHLENRFDAVVMEGAGSCCEVNLRDHDIVNFEMAFMANAPVILVADIDRGGVFAQIIGSLALMSQKERDLVKGFIINKFRGDPALFDSGISFIEKETGKPVFGLVPAYSGIRIDTEDSMSLDNAVERRAGGGGGIRIAVVRLPHISNFTDLEVLDNDPELSVTWLTEPGNLANHEVIVIPGSKSTIGDMAWLWDKGWVPCLRQYVSEKRGYIVGLCGGYQILGGQIRDPGGIEGGEKQIDGLGLLDTATEIDTVKIVRRTRGRDNFFNSDVSGYEIHMGKTTLGANARPFLELEDGPDGAINEKGTVFGAYLHGLFDSAGFRDCFLRHVAQKKGIKLNPEVQRIDHWIQKEENYNALADHFSRYLDVDAIIEVMRDPQFH